MKEQLAHLEMTLTLLDENLFGLSRLHNGRYSTAFSFYSLYFEISYALARGVVTKEQFLLQIEKIGDLFGRLSANGYNLSLDKNLNYMRNMRTSSIFIEIDLMLQESVNLWRGLG